METNCLIEWIESDGKHTIKWKKKNPSCLMVTDVYDIPENVL